MERAHKIPESEYTGPVLHPEDIGGQDGYYRSIEDMREELAEDDCPLPPFVWAVKRCPVLSRMFTEDIIERALEGSYEDAYCDLKGIDEFRAAVEAFKTANEEICDLDVDYSRAVVLENNSKGDKE